MIKAVLVINSSGKIRLCQFYEKNKLSVEQQQDLARRLHSTISVRSDDLCYFVDDFTEWPTPDTRVVYRRYATLCITFITDSSESCLAILDLIQVFVESLDKVFKNVCELDFFFHSEKVHHVLMEIVMGGMVLEMSKDSVVRQVLELDRLAGASDVTSSGGYSSSSTAGTVFGRGDLDSNMASRNSVLSSSMANLGLERSGVRGPRGGYHEEGNVEQGASNTSDTFLASEAGGRDSSFFNSGSAASLLGNPFNAAVNFLWGGK